MRIYTHVYKRTYTHTKNELILYIVSHETPRFTDYFVKQERLPLDLKESEILASYKQKEDVMHCENNRRIKPLEITRRLIIDHKATDHRVRLITWTLIIGGTNHMPFGRCSRCFGRSADDRAPGVTGQSISPAGLYSGLKRPKLDYTRVYYGLGQFIPRGILWPRPIHTFSGQIIHP